LPELNTLEQLACPRALAAQFYATYILQEAKMRKKLSLWFTSGTLLLTLFGSSAVFAEPNQPAESAETHCIGQAFASTDEQAPAVIENPRLFLPVVTNSNEATIDCFSSFAEAVSAASSGAISLAADATPDTVDAASMNAPGATTVIGVMYQHINFGGASFTWWVNNGVGCNTGLSYFVAGPPAGWNDVVSSARAWGGCQRWYHYEHANFGGAALVCSNSLYCRSSYGTMGDSASSWRWWRSGVHY